MQGVEVLIHSHYQLILVTKLYKGDANAIVMGNTTNRQTKTADVIYFEPYHLTF